MTAKIGQPKKITFLPFGTGAFFRRRLIELSGLALLLLGAALAIAFFGYNHMDPSLNTSTERAALNPLGLAGSYTADLTFQILGFSGYLLASVFVVWGWRLLSKKANHHFWLSFTALPLTLIFAAIALSILPVPQDWPLTSGLGGTTGQFLLSFLTEWTSGLGTSMTQINLNIILASLAVFLALLGFGVSLGLSGQEWASLLRRAGGILGGLVLVVSHLCTVFARELWHLVRSLLSGKNPALRIKPHHAAAPANVTAKPKTGATTLVAARSPAPTRGKLANSARQTQLKFNSHDHYAIPPFNLLDISDKENKSPSMDDEALSQNARFLESVLDEFGIRGAIIKVRPGPIVTLYELEPAPGTKTSRVIGLADDIARSMSAISARISAIPGRNAIGIELPNATRKTVLLRELLESKPYEKTTTQLPLVLGKDISGVPVIVDLARMPHLLVAGTTGSGKSVAINAMILSLLYRLPPDDCKLILIDPKMLELSVYDDIPHLLTPVVTEPRKAVVALRWIVLEMENRYRLMSHMGVRNIAGYNERAAKARAKGEIPMRKVQTGFDPETGNPLFENQHIDLSPIPFIVVVVDEMADLMLVSGKDIEAIIQRLSQMARAAGIHIIMATQRPSVDVITGTIKANFPTRISFQVTSKVDSRTILGEQGAEHLLGQGDMLYMATGGRVTRVHGPFVSDNEVESVVSYLKSQGEPSYVDSVTNESALEAELSGSEAGNSEGGDALYDQAVALVCRERKASTSFVQRHLKIGYNRAARLIEQMEAQGVIGPANHVGKREVLAFGHNGGGS
jgi:S-DNA-T family DNA segregation ATPase FtsK/SpoIIIE